MYSYERAMMEDTCQMDSLEDWVPVKPGLFNTDAESSKRFIFMVSWNDVYRKVAITCRQHNRVASDIEDSESRSGMFSFSELKAIHDILCLIQPSLLSYLPPLPDEPRSLWAYLGYTGPDYDYEEICCQLEKYFVRALEICKEHLLMTTLFEEPDTREYFDNMSELRRQNLEDEVLKCEERLKNVIFLRTNASNMHDMKDVYESEDDAVMKLHECLAVLYNYQQQPFLDLRAISRYKVAEAKEQLENSDLGERFKRQYATIFSEWQTQLEQAMENIQQLYIKYYSTSCQIYQAMLSRMLEDKKSYGKTAFELIGSERLLRIQEELSTERLHLLNSEKKLLVLEKDKVFEEIASLDETPNVQKQLEKLETKAYEWHIKIIQQMKILDEEEKICQAKMEALKKNLKAKEDEIVFYDAVEDSSQISPDEDQEQISSFNSNSDLNTIRRKMTAINKKRATLRNKKTALERQRKSKKEKKIEEEEKFRQHHAVQTKIDQKKEDTSRKADFIVEERMKAIDRIKMHKVKFPTPETIKPPRYQPPSQKKSPSSENAEKTETPVKKQKPLTNTQKTIKIPVKSKTTNSDKPAPKPRYSLEKKRNGSSSSEKPVEIQEKPQAVDPMDNILKMVRNGIKLRPVKHKEDTDSESADNSKFTTPSDSHLKLLHDRLNHINKFTRESSPESDSSDDGEFD
ncbi:unnamed protein product [Mytilus edulis]|uniref:JMY/WHAMM middle domain-containing protein n=1 Tax=Mytilus edulis TaxID=6550 RepID=A0A8S3Q7I4_MYTED|nr:unnamed protein product [Mytilus edulis]